jgi:hypothetical protein
LKIGKLALFIGPIRDRDHNKDMSFYFYLSHRESPLTLPWGNEQPRRKRRGIKRKLLNAPRGGEFNLVRRRRIKKITLTDDFI